MTDKPETFNNTLDGYDIIGDIHGQADRLIQLLTRMGYTHNGDCYAHPSRKALFLGDFIDRGPQQKQTLDTVIPMVTCKSAAAVMGNHELNALAYHTEHPQRPGDWLRPRSIKNTRLHQAFLDEYPPGDNAQLDAVLNFFYSLPLWLDLGELRLIHAAWHADSLAATARHLDDGNRLNTDTLVRATTPADPLYRHVETLLKGMEYDLPAGTSYPDKQGIERSEVRCWFFKQQGQTIGDIMVHPGSFSGPHRERVLNTAVDQAFLCGYGADEPPVFVGHYWMGEGDQPEPAILTDNVACVDYSAKNGGKLTVYRWSGESRLANRNFIYV